TEYDGSPDQLQKYTWTFIAGTTFIAAFANSYTATKVVTSTIFDYGTSIYLLHSAVARGQHQSLVAGTDLVQSYTEYDGSPDQLQKYTWTFIAGTTFIAAFANSYTAASVVTSTIFDYGTSIYLLHSAVARGQHQSLVAGTDIVQSYTEYDGSPDQL